MFEMLFPGMRTTNKLMMIKRLLDAQKKKGKSEEAADQSIEAGSARENADMKEQED